MSPPDTVIHQQMLMIAAKEHRIQEMHKEMATLRAELAAAKEQRTDEREMREELISLRAELAASNLRERRNPEMLEEMTMLRSALASDVAKNDEIKRLKEQLKAATDERGRIEPRSGEAKAIMDELERTQRLMSHATIRLEKGAATTNILEAGLWRRSKSTSAGKAGGCV